MCTKDSSCFVINAGLRLHMAVGYSYIVLQWNLLTLPWCSDMQILQKDQISVSDTEQYSLCVYNLSHVSQVLITSIVCSGAVS